MSHVSVHYKIYLAGGHHRQPRNASSQLEPNPPSEVDVASPGNITPLFLPLIPYSIGSASGLAKLLFWSVTDGTEGHTFPAAPLTQPVGANPLVITAWYLPISGPGGSGDGSAIIDDAFSAAKGAFIDDTFVVVTSDAALTTQANVVGVLPTEKALSLQAMVSVASTTEPFAKWLSFGAGDASGNLLQVPAGANGLAIAVYERSEGIRLEPGRGETLAGTLIGAVAVDGGGAIIVGGVPHPIDPWGPLMVELAQASLAVAGSRGIEATLGTQVRQLVGESVMHALRQAVAGLEKELRRKG